MIGDLILVAKALPGKLRVSFKQMFCVHEYKYWITWKKCEKCGRSKIL